MILRLFICFVVVLIAIGYIPIKRAVYADKEIVDADERVN